MTSLLTSKYKLIAHTAPIFAIFCGLSVEWDIVFWDGEEPDYVCKAQGSHMCSERKSKESEKYEEKMWKVNLDASRFTQPYNHASFSDTCFTSQCEQKYR